MKKEDMIQIDSAQITDEIEHRYLEYYETISETIKEAYRCLFYLEGLEQHFGQYKLSGYNYEIFIKDIIKSLKQKVCLDICKLIFDKKGNELLTIFKMQSYIQDTLKVELNELNIDVDTKLKNSIINMRNQFIGHNLHTENDCSVDMRELKPLLNDIYKLFQKLWIKNFVNDNLFIADGYFDFLKSYCITAVKESFMNIKP